ncbi:hypothetical protein [Rhizobium sp. SAFR-030]|uniref:hypothetical protein n=1 Tax=Rhizobium sp. SAFR-030 TaxID=3387277 RepID=UPI003F812110
MSSLRNSQTVRLLGITAGALSTLYVAGSLTLASAQDAGSSGAAQPQAGQPGEKCVVPPQSKSGRTAHPSAGSSTTQLSDCGGVLTPPAMGDGEMVEPAPSVGETPVIRPQEVPPNGATGQTKQP